MQRRHKIKIVEPKTSFDHFNSALCKSDASDALTILP
jgi:hypothetical protein